jgi:4-oxalocrotonate tautomerase
VFGTVAPVSSGEIENNDLAARHPTANPAIDQRIVPMPLIQVRVIKDVFSKEQKRQIISKLTDAMVLIEGENMRGVTWCVVEEVESGDWGIGGNALTTADVHALARGKAA